jgi:hypothetical protein
MLKSEWSKRGFTKGGFTKGGFTTTTDDTDGKSGLLRWGTPT